MTQKLLDGSNVKAPLSEVGGKRMSQAVTGDALDHLSQLRRPRPVGNDGLDSVIPVSPKGFHCFFRKRDLNLSRSHYAPSRRAVKCHVSQVGPRSSSPPY
jgi:hypothetical protein